MDNLLLWLAIPLLLLPAVSRPHRLASVTSVLIIAGFGLAALRQGAGTLDPRDLRAIASQSSHAAWFTGLTIGTMITGACLASSPRTWRSVAVIAPLLAGLLLAISGNAIGAAVTGAVIGLIPTAIGRWVLPRPAAAGAGTSRPLDTPGAMIDRPMPAILLGVVSIASALFGPIALALAALGALDWLVWSRDPGARAITRVPLLPMAATLLLGAWLWLALTIAGSPWIGASALATDAPISTAAAQWLALLALGWGIAIGAPWPVDRLAQVVVQLPALAVVLYLVARATPDGVSHWQPLWTAIMVLAAIAAAATRRWDGAAAALLLLAATRPGTDAVAASLLLAAAPAGRRLVGSARLHAALAGVAVALVVAAVLRDEVVLAVVLAFGMAAAAIRHDRVVAPQ